MSDEVSESPEPTSIFNQLPRAFSVSDMEKHSFHRRWEAQDIEAFDLALKLLNLWRRESSIPIRIQSSEATLIIEVKRL